jgi:hypothetical protein
MPVHDWSRVDAESFYQFHTAWIIHLSEALNQGLLPDGFYALAEQHTGRRNVADILKPLASNPGPLRPTSDGPYFVEDVPPEVSRKIVVRPPTSFRLA